MIHHQFTQRSKIGRQIMRGSGKSARSASSFGRSTFPRIASTLSLNFAGCAVPRTKPIFAFWIQLITQRTISYGSVRLSVSPVLLTRIVCCVVSSSRLHNPALSVARFCGGTTLPHAASCSADSRPSRWITSPESLWGPLTVVQETWHGIVHVGRSNKTFHRQTE